jgi:competence protein ComEA
MNGKRYLKSWFTLSFRERTGIMVLLILTVLSIAVNLCVRYYPMQKNDYDYSSYERELELFRKSLRSAEVNTDNEPEEPVQEIFRYSYFDPNTATEEELISVGIEEKIARRVLAYRKKGGRFHKKEEILKIYGFDPAIYTKLAPYILINEPSLPAFNGYPHHKEAAAGNYKIEINTSDTADFEALKGIGPVLATRIVKYRNRLGGFYSIDQIQEVYGISDSLFQAVKEALTVDTMQVNRICINEASEAQLSRHPYIGTYMAKAIITYRKTKGSISSIEELVSNRIIARENAGKIKAYLLFL